MHSELGGQRVRYEYDLNDNRKIVTRDGVREY